MSTSTSQEPVSRLSSGDRTAARPWLSVILPTYNGRAYLPAALASVASQDCADMELIAIDDGSTDGTVELLLEAIHRLPLVVVRQPHGGNWVASCNRGLQMARGDYVCILHQDDAWLPHRLAVLRALTKTFPQAVLLVHPSWFIDRHGRRLGRWSCPLPRARTLLRPGEVIERLLVQNFLAMPAPLFRRETALAVGGMDDVLWYTADWDLWLKLAAAGPTVCEPRPLAEFRVHPQSQTAQRTAALEEMRRQLERVLDPHLADWQRRHGRSGPEGAARFALACNLWLAGLSHGDRPALRTLLVQALHLRPAEWGRFLRDSCLIERVLSRLRLRWRD